MSIREKFPILVPDSPCLISLERIGRLVLLEEVASNVIVPEAVIREFGHAPAWLDVKSVADTAMVRSLHPPLGAGEAEVLALGTELGNVHVVIDERRARDIARRLGVPLVGTLGLLLFAKSQGILPAVKPCLDALDAVDFHLTDKLYQKVLRRANED